MAKRDHRKPPPDLATTIAGLWSADEELRIKALHAVCPCGSGFRLYEQLRGEVRRLQKDPSPRVREVALHVEKDAGRIGEIESLLERESERRERGERSRGGGDWGTSWELRQATRYWLPLGPADKRAWRQLSRLRRQASRP